MLAAGSLGCLEYSPNATPDERDLHRKAAERLQSQQPPEVLRFAVVGDTQGDFDEAEEIVGLLRRRDDLSLVIQLGDFTHLGLAPEYQLMHDIFRRLPVPYFVVIGAHEYFANGWHIYSRMFGPKDFAFTFARTRFILFDSNSVEFAFDGTVPDLAFVAAQLAPSPDHDRAFLFSHADPLSPDWDDRLRETYFALLRDAGVEASFHAHSHEPGEFERDGVHYFVAGAVDKRTYLVVTAPPDGPAQIERFFF
jgi:3',5'-cyclic AMP phosphodiesterase CpdA